MGLKENTKAILSIKQPSVFLNTRVLPVSEIFLATGGVFTFFKDNGQHISQNYYTEKSFWVKIALYTLIGLPNKLPYVVDGIQYKNSSSSIVVQYNYNFMLSDLRLHIHTDISVKQFFCDSLAPIYPSAVWLERELADFTGLLFQGLTDTRRLLLDYFQEKQVVKTHIHNEKSYNNTNYEVLLNF